jgi:hypothetical protein
VASDPDAAVNLFFGGKKRWRRERRRKEKENI